MRVSYYPVGESVVYNIYIYIYITDSIQYIYIYMPGKQYTESNKKYNIQYNWILGNLSNLGLQSSLGDDSPGVADGKL